MSLGLGQIFALLAEAPSGIAAGRRLAALYNSNKPLIAADMALVQEVLAVVERHRHLLDPNLKLMREVLDAYDMNKPALDRIMAILDDSSPNPLPAPVAREQAMEVLTEAAVAETPTAEQTEVRERLESVFAPFDREANVDH